ncbi:MAG: TCP-1/cpn60 chaperonin family protein [Parvibaculaceae bacterium]
MARVAAGAGVHRLLDMSLRPLMCAVGLSLGPDARTILYERGPGDVVEAASGFAIAREMPAPAGPRGTAPRLLKEALFAADRDFGDGTARLALIAGECFSAGAREVLGAAALRSLCEGMHAVSEEMADWLLDMREPEADMLKVARSCGLDGPLAERLADLVRDVGSDGIIDVKENVGRDVEVTRADGFVLDAVSVGNPALAVLSSPSILVADEIIDDFGSLARVLEGFAGRRKPLVIVARGITGAALATLRRNQAADIVTVAALQPAQAGQQAAEGLEDLAIASGATLVAERFGLRLESLRPPMLGQASQFRLADGRATFIAPRGGAEGIALRRNMLAQAAEKARHLSYDREVLERRRARLAGQWCEVRLGAESARARTALVTRARAALRSMQSAARHGAVPGGGALFDGLARRLEAVGGSEGDRAAARAVAFGLTAVPRWLAANSAAPEASAPSRHGPAQDSLFLNKTIIDQGVALAVALLRTGAVVTR